MTCTQGGPKCWTRICSCPCPGRRRGHGHGQLLLLFLHHHLKLASLVKKVREHRDRVHWSRFARPPPFNNSRGPLTPRAPPLLLLLILLLLRQRPGSRWERPSSR